jgi:hypothetical protein
VAYTKEQSNSLQRKRDKLDRKVDYLDERLHTCVDALVAKGWTLVDALVVVHTALEMPWDTYVPAIDMKRDNWTACLKKARKVSLEYMNGQDNRPGSGWARDLISVILSLRAVDKANADEIVGMVKHAKWPATSSA